MIGLHDLGVVVPHVMHFAETRNAFAISQSQRVPAMRTWVTAHRLAFLALVLTPTSATECPVAKRFRAPGEINPRTNNRYPRAMLFSYEGSGNTWTRVMLENITGTSAAAVRG